MTETPFVSYAQHGEDVVLWRALGDRENVVYVDVGAFDPTQDSVTRALYERGWRGVNIEPQPSRLDAFVRDRPEDTNLGIALGDDEGEVELVVPTNQGHASVLDPSLTGEDETSVRLTVPARRLASVLEELGLHHVDVLKVDVEGAEPDVVRGLLRGPVRPVVCVIEGMTPGLGRVPGDEAVALLVEAGYSHCMFDGLNHYLTNDPSLQDALAAPANPLDTYVTEHVFRLVQERSTLIATIATLASENVARGQAGRPADSEPAAPTEEQEPALDVEPIEELPAVVATDRPAGDADVSSPRDTARPPADPVVEPSVRASRRRMSFARLLSGAPEGPLPELGALPRILRLTSADVTPEDAVGVLYHEILGRAPDSAGRAYWVSRIAHGEPLIRLALDMAGSDEARARTRAERAVVREDLETWERMVTLEELGAGGWREPGGRAIGTIAHHIFVAALYEVALQRVPTSGEIDHEVAKLVAGVGREWMLRDFATRPETRARLLGSHAGLRSRVRRLRDRRHLVPVFRDLVTAAEDRQLTLLLAQLAAPEPVAHPGERTSPTPEPA